MIRDEQLAAVPDDAVAKLAALAHDRLGEMSDVQQARGLQDVVATYEYTRGGPRRRLSPRTWLVGAGAAAALCLLVRFAGSSWLGPGPLTYALTQGELQAGGYFRAGTKSQPTLRFSDGTSLDLMAGARGRIASVDARGARVVLDEGESHVVVVPRKGAHWLFDAGPFLVHVQGTEFALAWRGDEGRLDVRLHQGAVSVTGPVSDQAIVLRPGQWLTVRLATHEVFVRDFDRAAPPPLPRTVTPPPVPATLGPAVAPTAPEPVPAGDKARRPAHVPPSTSAAAEPPWTPARAEGDWERILELATRRGLERTLAERGGDDLALLSDAAHYLHRDDIARQALLALRRRFPGSTRAKDAAFLLGRILEAKAGGGAEALTWYERHLEEAPAGAYASEALGRKLTVLARLRGDEAARPVAEAYLRRYPGGTYARAARAYASKP